MPTFIAIGSFPLLKYSLNRQRFVDRLRYTLRRESEFLEQFLRRAGGAEMVDPDDLTLESHVVPPGLGCGRLDRNAARNRRRQHAVPIGIVLAVEGGRARHGHEPRLAALRLRGAHGFSRDPDLRARGNDDHLGWPLRVDEDIAAALDGRHLRGLACLMSERLARQDEASRPVSI